MDAASLSKPLAELKLRWAREVEKTSLRGVLEQIFFTLANVHSKNEIRIIVNTCVPREILYIEAAQYLRQQLPADKRVDLYLTGNAREGLLLRETAGVASKASQEHFGRFWREAANYVEYEGFLWHLAPDEVKDTIRRKRKGLGYIGPRLLTNAASPEAIPVVDWAVELTAKPVEEVFDNAANILKNLRQRGNRLKFVQSLPELLLELPEAGRMRRMLPVATQVTLYSKLVLLLPLSNIWLLEVKEFLSRIDGLEKRQFWQTVAGTISADSYMLAFAPEEINRQVQKRGFEKFYDLLERPKTLKPRISATFRPQQIYGSLNDEDNELAKKWAQRGEADDSHEMARMLSARSAEKVAGLFYERLGYLVDDTAIEQLNAEGQSKDWLRYDISLDNHINIDVKNARLPHKREVYIEHVVPRFKQDRKHQNVFIAGVQSPYVQLEHIQNPDGISPSVPDIIFLGHTRIERLGSLEGLFSEPLNLTLTSRDDKGTFIPHWAFEYPKRSYAWTELEKEKLHSLSTIPVPPLNIVRKIVPRPIPIYLAFGALVPSEWLSELPRQQVRLIKRLERTEQYIHSLPYVFLSVLSHFVERLREVVEDGSDSLAYVFDTVFFSGKTEDERSFSYPLGIYDLLKTVYNLCLALEKVWERRHDDALRGMSVFRLTGKGLLQGKSAGRQAFTTLLAYCGGSIEGKGKCGYSPLIIGVHPTCDYCRKLICRECDFCKRGCQRPKVGAAQTTSTSADVQRLLDQYEYGDSEYSD